VHNFKDCERPVLELKTIMLKSPYVWTAVYNSSHLSNLLEFQDLFS
jgi:hypothetical protein